MKRAAILIALLSVLALGGATPAEAHFLSLKRARNATFNVMREECRHVQSCQGFAAGPCKRVSEHKVRCLGHFYGRNADVGEYDCHRQVTIRILPDSRDRFYKTRKRHCVPNEDHLVE